ncbi:MAG: phage portal protein, partial [Oscillospiraceae bacterium]|nr:phage portal protein [Oscillospiraceae bacterium]
MLSKLDIAKFISDDFYSKQKQNARKGQEYYEGKHDILNYRLFYFNSDGLLREDRYRSNVKIPHPFFTEIVNQAVQYIFSDTNVVKSDNPQLQKYLDGYFNSNESFTDTLSELMTGCMAKGTEYL